MIKGEVTGVTLLTTLFIDSRNWTLEKGSYFPQKPTGKAGGKNRGSSLLRENWLQSLVRDRKDKNLLGLALGLTEFLNFIDYI